MHVARVHAAGGRAGSDHGCASRRRRERRQRSRRSSGWRGRRCAMRASRSRRPPSSSRIAGVRRCGRPRAEQQTVPRSRRAPRNVRPCVQERADRQAARRGRSEIEQRQALLQQQTDREQARAQQRIDLAAGRSAPRTEPQPGSACRAQRRRGRAPTHAPAAELRLVQSDALLQASVAPGASAASAIARRALLVGLAARVAQQFARRLGAVERAQRAALDLPARCACAPAPSGWRRRGGCGSPW